MTFKTRVPAFTLSTALGILSGLTVVPQPVEGVSVEPTVADGSYVIVPPAHPATWHEIGSSYSIVLSVGPAAA